MSHRYGYMCVRWWVDRVSSDVVRARWDCGDSGRSVVAHVHHQRAHEMTRGRYEVPTGVCKAERENGLGYPGEVAPCEEYV
jgi:hypothetical protein